MTDLDTLCHKAGLVWVYRDGAGRMQEAPEESRLAVLRALGYGNPDAALPEALTRATSMAILADTPTDLGPEPWELTLETGETQSGSGPLPPLPVGYHLLKHKGWSVHLLAAPPALPLPPRRWGVTLPLFSLWNERQAGLGSYSQLRQATQGLAAAGASFVGINPIHAGFPTDPNNFSPYAPSHRRRWNTLHIDTQTVDAAPASSKPNTQAGPFSAGQSAAPVHSSSDTTGTAPTGSPAFDQSSARTDTPDNPTLPETGALIDYPRTIRAQRAALEDAFARFSGDPDFETWRGAQGQALELFATHQALSEVFGPYWTDWPSDYHSPDSPQVAQFAREHHRRLRFHAWCQWRAECQLQDVQNTARHQPPQIGDTAGHDAHTGEAQRTQETQHSRMEFGLYLDIAVGTHPSGAETWIERTLFAQGISLGAPPDLLGPSGQRWGLAPLRPDMLRATGYAAFAQTLRQQLKFCGLLRIDHILGLERSFWLPDGLPGLYVTMPREELLAVLRIEAHRAGATVIGEDLGTIPDGLRDALSNAGVLGCRVAMFERHWDTSQEFLTPDEYTQTALASWGTHDLPTWLGWREGRDLEWRHELGELPDLRAAKEERARDVARFDAKTGGPTLDHLHSFLAASASQLVAVQGEDLLEAVEQANLPGTVHEHPNWCRRLPLPLSGLISAPTLAKTSAIMRAAGRNS